MYLITCWVHAHAHTEEPREDVELPWAGTYLRFLFYTLKTEDQAVAVRASSTEMPTKALLFPSGNKRHRPWPVTLS